MELFLIPNLIDIGLYNENFKLNEEKELRKRSKKNLKSKEFHFHFIGIGSMAQI